MKFNNEETKRGYLLLTQHLKEVVNTANYYMLAKYNFEITITDTMRSLASQDYIYRNDEKYKKKKFQSVHMFGRGVDISVKGMTPDMIVDLLTVLNLIKYSDKYKTAIHHDVGSGDHIHLQVPWKRCIQNEPTIKK